MKRYVDKPDIYFIKENVSRHEHLMHKYIQSLDILNVPKVISYNKQKKRMVMAKIHGDNISDMYGENIKDVPDNIYNTIKDIIHTLAEYNICYPDFTGYNFIIDKNDKFWIIDFEHSYFEDSIDENETIQEILYGEKKWNGEFA